MTLACCAWAIVPLPSLLQPRRSVSAFKQQATDLQRTARLDRPGRSGAYVGLPSLACNVIRNRVVGGKGCLPACLASASC